MISYGSYDLCSSVVCDCFHQRFETFRNIQAALLDLGKAQINYLLVLSYSHIARFCISHGNINRHIIQHQFYQ